jgi:hypothetical protein
MTPDELIDVLERAAHEGVHPRRVLLALGFRPAGSVDPTAEPRTSSAAVSADG